MDAAGPGVSFLLIKDPHDQTEQTQVSNIYYKTIYKSLFPPVCNVQQMLLKRGIRGTQ